MTDKKYMVIPKAMKKLLRIYGKVPLSDDEINEIIQSSPELENTMMFFIDRSMTALMKKRYKLILDFARAIEKAHGIGEKE